MLRGGPGFSRMAAVAVAGASCLAAAACGGVTAARLNPVPSVNGAVDPLAHVTASKVAAEAGVNAQDAQTLTMTGTATESGTSFALTLSLKRGVGCSGTVDYPGKGSVKLIVIGKNVYLKADAKFWDATLGSKASTLLMILDNRYLEVPASDSGLAELAGVCDLSKALKSNPSMSYTKEAVTTYGGARVLPLKASDGSTVYVTDTSKPEVVRAFAPSNTPAGAGDIAVVIDAPVTVSAPPASQVLNERALGLSPGSSAQPTPSGPSLN